MKLAIIGSGISGLVAAHRLCGEHEITLFEANDYLGGHTNTVEVSADGEQHAIDTGFIVFNDWTYPNFMALLDELGVKSRPTTMSFSVHDDRSGLEYNGHSLNTLFAQRRNLLRPSFHRMLFDILRFNREARQIARASDPELTVAQFLASRSYSRAFAEWYLLPIGAAIWSCPTGTFAQFPLQFIVDFYHNHGLLNILRRPQWRVVEGGSWAYVRAIAARLRAQVRLKTPVVGVTRHANGVNVQPRGGPAEPFDHVIFACHSDQVLRLLGNNATAFERETLAALPYGRNVAVLHTDTSLLPTQRRAWASWNYRIKGDGRAAASVTYNMNILQRLRSRQTFCVSLNDEENIRPDRVLGRFVYHHPIFTAERAAAQSRHGQLVNANRTSYCGAYWRNGFHEDGVNSALAVVSALRQSGPIDTPPLMPFDLAAAAGVERCYE